MKVRKSLYEVYSELTDLLQMRKDAKLMVATATINKSKFLDDYIKDYLHYDEVIKYMSSIFVEYEDKYETDEE